MNAESTYFLTAGCTALMMAVLITRFGLRHREIRGLGYWVLATWLFVLTDVLFVASANPAWPAARYLSRVGVSATYGVILLASQSLAGARARVVSVVAMLGVYALVLAYVFAEPQLAPWRVVSSRLLWGACCALGWRALRWSGGHLASSPFSPAGILLLQAGYLFLRAGTYAVLTLLGHAAEPAVLVYVDYADSVMFDIALFVALLVALIESRNDELRASRAEVRTLSGLLPICAECKKIRDEHGQWNAMEVYISSRTEAGFSHGCCPDCAASMRAEFQRERTRPAD